MFNIKRLGCMRDIVEAGIACGKVEMKQSPSLEPGGTCTSFRVEVNPDLYKDIAADMVAEDPNSVTSVNLCMGEQVSPNHWVTVHVWTDPFRD
jgi:hypothetical protein